MAATPLWLVNSPKYLMYFSYIGTRYAGIQRQTSHDSEGLVDNSIQYHLERALGSISPTPANAIRTNVSSRTDQGVHGLKSSFQSHLTHPDHPNTEYNAAELTQQLNSYLSRNLQQIIVNKTFRISREVSARANVQYREYVYRMIFKKMAKKMDSDELEQYQVIGRPLVPLVHQNRIGIKLLHPDQELNLEKVQTTLDLFTGTKDFSSFQGPQKQRIFKDGRIAKHRDPVKCIMACSVQKLDLRSNSRFDKYYDGLEMYEFRVRGKSFLYKQIRRMVGCAISVGLNKVTMDQINQLLEQPGSWDNKLTTAQPFGLFLADVNYDEADFSQDCTQLAQISN